MAVLILRDSVLVDAAFPDRAVGFINHDNPLASVASLPEKLLAPSWVCWSGWVGGEETRDAESVEPDFQSWSRDAWDRLGRWCDELLPRLKERGIELWFRPHCRHILSDPQSCVTFLARRQGQPIRVLFEPSAFLTPDMLARSEDHVERSFAALGAHPGVAAVLLTNRRRSADSSEPMRASPVHHGELDPHLIVRLWKQHVPTGTSIVLLGDELDEQRRFLDLP